MPQGPAARVTDPVAHPLPPILTGGPGSLDVQIGMLPAWRGIPMAAATALQTAKQASDQTIQVAEAATLAAAGTPGLPAAKAAEETVKATAAATMGSMISGMSVGADKHICATPLPIPPHGPGVVIDGSQTVLINNMPSCRVGDTIVEAVGPPNKIAMGCPTVIIGDSGSGNTGGAMVAAKIAGAPFAPSDCPLNQGNWWNQNIEDPVADAFNDGGKSIPKGFAHDLYGAVVGVGQGGYEFGKGMVTGLWSLATDRKTQKAVWNAAKQVAEDGLVMQFGAPQDKLKVAEKYVGLAKQAAQNIAKETEEGYNQAAKEGNESQYVAKTVTRVGLEIGSLFLGGAGAAGKVAEAGNVAGKVAEAGNIAGKTGEAANVAGKTAEAANASSKAEKLAETGRVLDKRCPACDELAKAQKAQAGTEGAASKAPEFVELHHGSKDVSKLPDGKFDPNYVSKKGPTYVSEDAKAAENALEHHINMGDAPNPKILKSKIPKEEFEKLIEGVDYKRRPYQGFNKQLPPGEEIQLLTPKAIELFNKHM